MSKRNFEPEYQRQDAKVQKAHHVQSFRLKRTQDYEGSFPPYKQPQEVTSYSIDHQRHVWFDNREMVNDALFFIIITVLKATCFIA